MTPLERAATAVREADGTYPNGDGKWMAEGGIVGDDHWLSIARAVLEAIREPSEVMAKAGTDTLPAFEAPLQADASDCWQAMIDAALGEV